MLTKPKYGGVIATEELVSHLRLSECSLSEAGLPTKKWSLVDVAHNNTRGSSQRLKEKRGKIRQAMLRLLPESKQSPRDALHSTQDQVRGLEQQLQGVQQRAQAAEAREP